MEKPVGGYFPWKGFRGRAEVKTPFLPLSCSTRPAFQLFLVPQDLTKNQTIFANFPFKMLNFGKFLVPDPKNQPNQVQEVSIWAKINSRGRIFQTISSTSPQIWRRSILQTSIFGPWGHSPLLKPKLSTPQVEQMPAFNSVSFHPIVEVFPSVLLNFLSSWLKIKWESQGNSELLMHLASSTKSMLFWSFWILSPKKMIYPSTIILW